MYKIKGWGSGEDSRFVVEEVRMQRDVVKRVGW
jgi:hypothetical protein